MVDKFTTVTEGIRGRMRECFVDYESLDRAGWSCEYYVKVSLQELNDQLKKAVEEDAILRDNVEMENFDKITDDVWKSNKEQE